MELVDTVTRHAHQTTDEQVQGLRDLGWTDEQMFEAVWVVAAFSYMTRVVDAFGINWKPEMLNPHAQGTKKID